MRTFLTAIAMFLASLSCCLANDTGEGSAAKCLLRIQAESDTRIFVDSTAQAYRNETGILITEGARDLLRKHVLDDLSHRYKIIEAVEDCPPGMTMFTK